jgi:virginiamycin B lyase
MKHNHTFRALAILSLFFGALVLVAEQSRAADTSSYPYMNEYPLRSEDGWLGGAPEDIVAVGPGHVWFTLPESDQVGELTILPSGDYEFDFHQLDIGSNPAGIAYTDGFVWITAPGTNKLLRIDSTTGVQSEWPLPVDGSEPAGIAAGPTGNLWIAATGSNQILRFEPGTVQPFTQYDYPSEGARITEITVYSDNLIYFTAEELDMVVRLIPTEYPSNGFTPAPLIDAFTGSNLGRPGQIAVNSAGHLWVVAAERNLLGFFSPGTFSYYRWVEAAPVGIEPYGLVLSATDSTHLVWFTLPEIARVGLHGRNAEGLLFVRMHIIPSAGSIPRSVAVDSDNRAWIAVAGSNLIAEWVPPYSQIISLPLLSNNS